MKRSEAVLRISTKLQKQLHLMKSQIMLDNPKMLCDNLALRVMSEIEELGMLPPETLCDQTEEHALLYGVSFNGKIRANRWENEEC